MSRATSGTSVSSLRYTGTTVEIPGRVDAGIS